MGSYRTQLTEQLARVAAGNAMLERLARSAARRWAGRHYVAAVAVVLDDDAVLLAQHRFHQDRWALPGGWVRRREDPARACERELTEELGVAVDAVAAVAVDPHAIDGVPLPYGGLTIAFRCELRDGTVAPVPRSVEISAAQWVPTTEADRYVHGFQLAAIAAAQVQRRASVG